MDEKEKAISWWNNLSYDSTEKIVRLYLEFEDAEEFMLKDDISIDVVYHIYRCLPKSDQ